MILNSSNQLDQKGGEKMDFGERFDYLISAHGMNKKGVASLMQMPYSTFLYKSTREDSWMVRDFLKLIQAMNLTKEEQDFLFNQSSMTIN